MTRDRISPKRMKFHALVGLLPHEAHVAQPLEVDLTVWPSLRHAGQTDLPSARLDCRDLHAMVADSVGRSHHHLLEGLCVRIASRGLSFPGVERVRVALRKPHAPIDGPLDHVEVVIDRNAGPEPVAPGGPGGVSPG